MRILRIRDVTKRYGGKLNPVKALDGITLSVAKGEFVAIMGASGSGKTTLLNCISTIDKVTSGHVFIEDVDVTKLRGKRLSEFRRDRLGFIFQDFNLLDTLTAFENIAIALSIQGTPADEIRPRVERVARQLGIPDVLSQYPYQLSGGQKQRVAAARAIVTKPALVLADEPTGALDSNSARMLMDRIAQLNSRLKSTVLMVTHDPLSASYATRVIFLSDGKLFAQTRRGEADRQTFYNKIVRVMARLGGDAGVTR